MNKKHLTYDVHILAHLYGISPRLCLSSSTSCRATASYSCGFSQNLNPPRLTPSTFMNQTNIATLAIIAITLAKASHPYWLGLLNTAAPMLWERPKMLTNTNSVPPKRDRWEAGTCDCESCCVVKEKMPRPRRDAARHENRAREARVWLKKVGLSVLWGIGYERVEVR